MTNLKALAVTERTALSHTVFENPELTAMAAICEILQELPDEAARLRVMHWSFGRFSPEFKRSAPQPVAPTSRDPVALAPAAPIVAAEATADMETQISELEDLFASDAQSPSRRVYAELY